MDVLFEKKLYAVKTAIGFLTEEQIVRAAYNLFLPLDGEIKTAGIIHFSYKDLVLFSSNTENNNRSNFEVFRIDSGLPLQAKVKIRQEVLEKINLTNQDIGETLEESEAYIIESEVESINLEEVKQNIITYFKENYEEIQKAIF
ncbi:MULTISPECIES: hypothetical protein [unclassified Bacillus cereus group]|uniref:hypothetical protein n=1 Tax=unclassified Bacillus cereus group TaxID=2750818 RepID=UPI0029C55EC9|nr:MULTISPECIES: hypothetical protein [unclassified Bacillus cereus group]MDX5880812.1 hypothetical protein [Bacillus cereus group sp. BfR-BA-01042]MDX5906672.1 hypothetical protein [Bacillus cereus group sp. BfR-BA-01048]